MPELPEVETTARGLEIIRNQEISKVKFIQKNFVLKFLLLLKSYYQILKYLILEELQNILLQI